MLVTSGLKQREVPATLSSFYVSVVYVAMLGTSIAAVVLGCFYFRLLDCDASVMVVDCAAVETGSMLAKQKKVAIKYVCFFYFLVQVLLRAAAVAHNISIAAERGTGYCFFLVRFCSLHCDAWDVYCCCCSWLLLFLSFRLRCFGYGC